MTSSVLDTPFCVSHRCEYGLGQEGTTNKEKPAAVPIFTAVFKHAEASLPLPLLFPTPLPVFPSLKCNELG